MDIKKLNVKELEELQEMIRKRELIEQGNHIFHDMQNRSTAQNILDTWNKLVREHLREDLRKDWLDYITRE
jgi:uncharacterized membrane protein YheB (UPF0754 family)